MIEVRLFSRRNGWPGGRPIGMFHSPIFHVPHEIFPQIEDKKGKEVFKVMKMHNIEVPNHISCFDNWYCYTADTQITAGDSI
jgi:hypothetical protein